MTLFVEIIRHTPLFVWVIAVLICARAARALRTRWVSLTGLFVVPIIFVAIGIAGASLQSSDDLIGWAVLAFLLVPTGYFTAPQPLAIDHAGRRLQLRRSLFNAMRAPVIFLVRYALQVAIAVEPRHRTELVFATSVFSGAVVGYYLGWSLGLLQAYYLAPRAPSSFAQTHNT
jgi:hypothetical protein